MTFLEIIILALSLSVDSFIVSLSGGVSLGKLSPASILRLASVFAIVQAGLFFAGWILAVPFATFTGRFGGIAGFLLLLYIGIDMIVSSVRGDNRKKTDLSGFMPVLLASVATSIDASAVGVSLALSDVCKSDIFCITVSVFFATLAASALGTVSGSIAGRRFGPVAGIAGGIVLIVLGIRILL